MKEYFVMLILIISGVVFLVYGIALWFGLIIFIQNPNPIASKVMLPIIGLVALFLGVQELIQILKSKA